MMRLPGVIAAAGVASLVLSGGAVHLILAGRLQDDAARELGVIAAVIEQDLATFADDRFRDLRLVASRMPGEADRSAAEAELARVRDAYGVYARLRLVGIDGRIVADTGHDGIGELDEQTQPGRPRESWISWNRGRGTIPGQLVAGVPWAGGWVVAEIPIARIGERCFERLPLPKGASVRIADTDGRIICSSGGAAEAGMQSPVVASPGSATSGVDAGMLVCAVASATAPWQVTVHRPLGMIHGPGRRMLLVVAGSLLVAVVVGFVLIRLALVRINAPIARLVDSLDARRRHPDAPLAAPVDASPVILDLYGAIGRFESVMRDRASALAAAQARLADQEERLRLALEAAGIGMWDWNIVDGTVHYSDTLPRMFGLDAGSLDGRLSGWMDLVHPDDRDRVRADIARHFAEPQRMYRVEVRCRHADGSWVWILDAGRVVERGSDGRPRRMLGVHVDITATKHVQEQLVEARQLAEAAARAKSDFLATMSHEIRTPMNGVLGFTDLLMSERLEPRHMEMVATIRRSGEALLVVLNDILDFSKIEAGRIELAPRPCNMVAEIGDIAAMFRAPASAKGIALELSVASAVPEAMLIDPNRVRQVITNLVSNAVKFTERGSVHITVAHADGRLRIAIADTGIGIAAVDLPRLFQRFSQVDQGDARRFGGTGLGLAISDRLVQLMGGRIDLVSAPGTGSTFTVDLPAPACGGKPDLQSPVDDPACAGIPVLVAEDNLVNQRVALAMLQRLGCVVELVSDGAAAVAAWEREPGRTILMDLQMPVMDGLTAARAIRHKERERGCPRSRMIALTASALDGEREAALAAGMDAVLTKPIIQEALVRSLHPISAG